MAEVVLKGVSKRFGETIAVDDLHLTVADGEFVVLLGPTGAGKTTTLRLVAGLESAAGGHITIGGVHVTRAAPAARDRNLVFQPSSLVPHLSVSDHASFLPRPLARRTV